MKKSIILALGVVLVAGSAWAAAFNTRPISPLGPSSDGIELQTLLNNVTVSGGIDAVADQTPFALFTSGASGGSVATFMFEVAGNAGTNVFGLYDAGDPTNLAQIFGGPAGPGDQALVSFLANGDIRVNGATVASGFGTTFGFYMTGAQGTFYTEDDLNPAGAPQALVYQGDNSTVLQIPPFAAGVFSANEFIFAFEDLIYANSDKDFNDLVVLVESINPIPEPTTMILLGSGLLGLAGVGRKRKS